MVKVKTKIQKIFWDCVFKGLFFGGLMGLSRFCKKYAKDVEIPTRQQEIPKIFKEIADEHSWATSTRLKFQWFSNILMYFMAVDTAVSYAVEDFVKKYYKRFNK